MLESDAGLKGFRPSPETNRATKIRQQFDQTCAHIRADPDRSAEGKRKAMAAAWLQVTHALNEIRVAEEDAITARRARLQRQLFGVADDPMSRADYRAAQDTAEQAAADKGVKGVARLLDRALTRTFDTSLAKACAAIAVERGLGWEHIISSYVAARPADRDALAELRDIDNQAADTHNRISRQAVYQPRKPPELARLGAAQIAALAAANDDPAATATAG